MAGTNAIGGTQVTVQEVKAKPTASPGTATEGKPSRQIIAGPVDRYHGNEVSGSVGCPMPPPEYFRVDPHQEARDMIHSVLKSNGAGQLEAFYKFTEKVKYASTATLKEALTVLAEEEKGLNPFVNRGRLRIIQLLRNTIEAELKTRPNEPKDEARELIDAVADKWGAAQMEAFVKFADDVKHVSRDTLREMRDQLIDRMANESDREQRLIYKLMLQTVNRELEAPRTIRLRDVLPYPFPQPIVAPFALSAEEHRLLSSKLSGAGAQTQSAVKAIVGIKD